MGNIATLGGAVNASSSKQTATGYEKTEMQGGNMVSEEWDNQSKSRQLQRDGRQPLRGRGQGVGAEHRRAQERGRRGQSGAGSSAWRSDRVAIDPRTCRDNSDLNSLKRTDPAHLRQMPVIVGNAAGIDHRRLSRIGIHSH